MKRVIILHMVSLAACIWRAGRQPNLVFILADDLGYGDIGCFGAPDIETPHLDRLAEEGIRLTSNYSNSAVCSPTRAAFMTGRYFQRLGLEWAVWYQAPGEGLPPTETSLASMIRAAGYQTALAGKWHLGYENSSIYKNREEPRAKVDLPGVMQQGGIN